MTGTENGSWKRATPIRLGLANGQGGMAPERLIKLARLAEDCGYDSMWFGEAYGADVVVPLSYVAAHTSRLKLGAGVFQIDARTPAMTAMTAATLDRMSGGRLLCGIGASGPQVVEGWHGVAYGKPLAKTRDYVAILRAIWARKAPLEFAGSHYTIPYQGADATGLGKPLKSIQRPRPDIPIYIAAIGPKNVALAGQIADGFIPLFWSPEHWTAAFGEALAGVDFDRFDVAANVPVAMGDDIAACRDQVRPFLALYVGGMGARGRNFYNDLVCRFGYEDAAKNVQDAYLDGRQADAAAAIPDALIDELALVGPAAAIADRLQAWKETPVGSLVLNITDESVLRQIPELLG